MNTDEIIQEIRRELEQYKYPYDERAKLLNAIILLLELYEEEAPPQWVPRSWFLTNTDSQLI